MAEEKKEKKWIVGEIATQTQQVLINTTEKENNQYGLYEMMAKLANDIEEIKKGLLN